MENSVRDDRENRTGTPTVHKEGAAGVTPDSLYYDADNWQVLSEYDDAGTQQAYYVFGNYIDEVLLMHRDSTDRYYLHDHLYSPAALLNDSGTVLEYYEWL